MSAKSDGVGSETAPVFDTWDSFLKSGIRDYYTARGKSEKGRFIALVMASGQGMGLAKDAVTGEGGVKRAAIGAGAVVALRVGLGYALSGPLGILLTGLGAASLIAYFVKNQKDISTKIGRYRQLISDTHGRFDDIQSGYRGNRYDVKERNLMVDGLQRRFVSDCDNI